MKKKYFIRTLFVLLILIIGSYFIPAPQADFFDLYTKNDKPALSLKEFKSRATKQVTVNNVKWNYLTSGNGKETILFLHGMGGTYDLWWQQVIEFEKSYKIITYTLPEEINSLEKVSEGILKILETENIDEFNVIGTSMGGYIAQYLVSTIPNRIEKAVFANTFPPNNLIEKVNATKSKVIPYLPEILLSKLGEKKLNNELIPSAKNSELLLAFLPSLPFSKKQFMNRFYVVIDKFTATPAKYEIKRIPKLIIESDNDPLIQPQLRTKIKELYLDTEIYTFKNEGHFPYINASQEYNTVLRNFLTKENEFKSVEKTIHNYFEGRKNANLEILQTAFSKNASLYTSLNNTELIIPFDAFLKKVKSDGVQQIKTSILNGDIEGDIANFKTQFIYSNTSYSDYLTLLKVQNEWEIISKTFTKNY